MFPLDNNLTIDFMFKILLERLTREHRIRDVTKDLLGLKDNDKRVLYMYGILDKYDLLPLPLKVDKCEYVSTYYRGLGNLYYQRGNLYVAWQYYNLALMNSPLTAQTYALAVANRSAVFAALKEYKACLEDIKMVFTIQYPDKIRDKLLKRKALCEDAIEEAEEPDLDDETENDVTEIFALKSPKNDRYESASSKLQVKHNQDFGRHVVAKEDIEVGEIIVQEDPYVKLLLKSQYIFACAKCVSRKLNLYPCPFCCVTMYCSRPCVNQAWEEYHSFECPLLASLIKMEFSKLELLALRTTIKARTDHENWNSVLMTIIDAESTILTDNWGHIKFGDKWVYDSKFYPSIHTLATNIEKRDILDIFQKTVTAAVLFNYLGVVNFVKADNDSDLKDLIISFTTGTLLLHLMTAPTNMHGITTIVENCLGNYVEEYNIGSAPYAFLSLINHSCAPNVVRYSRLGMAQMTLIALRPIKTGMQILDNYGAHHELYTKEERQDILKSQYKFTCRCEACTDDWPACENLGVITNLPAAIANKKKEFLSRKVIEDLRKGNRKCALKSFKPLCELVTALDPYAPCREAAECQTALKQCLAILSGVLPNGFTRFIEWEMPPPNIPGKPVSTRFYLGGPFHF